MELIESPAQILDVHDPINPAHYKIKNFDSFEFISAVAARVPGDEAVSVGNILKYVIRYSQKNGIEDLKKALWYLNRLIKILEDKK